MKFPVIPPERLVQRLQPPDGKIEMVLDTDTYNEIDDQFAVLYALKSEDRLQVEAIYAAPYRHKTTPPDVGMERSYQEILKILSLVGKSPDQYAFRGSAQFMPGEYEPVQSAAAADLVRRAMARADDDPLYVVAIGAITNVASAIAMEPAIIEKIVIVWLAGHSFQSETAREYNLYQDAHASRLILNCGVPLVLIPCEGVASHLFTTLAEIEQWIKVNPIGEYLYETFKRSRQDHFGYARVIWDISAIAYLIRAELTPSVLTHSPILTDQMTWSFDATRHLIRYVKAVKRNDIFQDMFRKLIRED